MKNKKNWIIMSVASVTGMDRSLESRMIDLVDQCGTVEIIDSFQNSISDKTYQIYIDVKAHPMVASALTMRVEDLCKMISQSQ